MKSANSYLTVVGGPWVLVVLSEVCVIKVLRIPTLTTLQMLRVKFNLLLVKNKDRFVYQQLGFYLLT